MRPIFAKLQAWGYEADCLSSRFMNDEDFYLNMLDLAVRDKNFDKLRQAIADHDSSVAFMSAHTLKGMLGNMGLTPLYEPASEITELLRDGADGDVSQPCAALERAYQELLEILADESL